jgi:hypothetical protein
MRPRQAATFHHVLSYYIHFAASLRRHNAGMKFAILMTHLLSATAQKNSSHFTA